MSTLLTETHLFKANPVFLTEGKVSDRGLPLVEGILATAEVKNGNGRYYSRELWDREIDKYMPLVKENRAMGELDHPESSVINLKNVSHNIREIYWEGDDVCGVVEILSTPSGNILKELLKNNIRLGISSRGLGQVKELKDGTVMVAEDFELIGWDFVSNPSTHGAFMAPLQESKQWAKIAEECGKWCKSQDLMREIIIELN